MRRALVTGGNGLVGRELIKRLLEKGIEVYNLSRSGSAPVGAKGFKWDYTKNEIDKAAIQGVEVIFHLAGAGVAEKRWNKERKQEILDSRVKTAELLYRTLKDSDHSVQQIVSASGVAIYGVNDFDRVFKETDPRGSGFLADVTEQWEQAVSKFSDLGIKTASIRIAMVLSAHGGALSQLVTPAKFGVGSPLASGKQKMPWIHIEDLARMFLFVEEKGLEGVFNAVADDHVSNKAFTKTLCKVLNRPMILPNVPAFALRLMLGEMANEIAINGSAVTSKKISGNGFKFEFDRLEPTLENLLKAP